MPKTQTCIYGGGDACVRQGGSGTLVHATGHTHTFPAPEELGEPIGDPTYPVQKGLPEVVSLVDLESFFDDDIASAILKSEIHTPVDSSSLVLKSLYDFDLETPEGIKRLMALLHIMDPEILKEVVQEIWPGYPVEEENFVPKAARLEIRGYLLDYLAGHGKEDTITAEE